MQVFKAFFKISWKHLPSISIYFIIYLVITFLLSATGQKNIDQNFEASALEIYIADEDMSDASQALSDYLGSIHHLSDLENDTTVLQDHLYYRTIDYILVIPKGFEEALLKGDAEALLKSITIPGTAKGTFVDQQISQYLKSLQLYITGGKNLNDAISETDSSIARAAAVNILTFQAEDVSATANVFYFYQYLPYVFITMLFSGLAPVIITFTGKNINERISCSSITLTNRNGQLAIGCVLYSIFMWSAFMISCFLFHGKTMFGYYSLLGLLNSLVFLLIAVAMTLLTSCFSPNLNVLSMVSNIIGLGMAFLCGVFVPQSLLSDNVLSVSRFLPAYWYVRANNMLAGFSSEAFDLGVYWTAIGIQLLFATAVFAAALAATKLHRQRSSLA